MSRRILLFAALLLCVSPVLASQERITNFALLDQEGRQHELSHYGDSRAVVIVALASDCRENLDQLHKYQLLRTTWEPREIVFLGLSVSPQDNRDSIADMAARYPLGMPIMLDPSQLVAEGLGIEQVGEIVVVEPERLRILYRGGLDREPQRALPTQGVAAHGGTSVLADTLAAAVAGELDSAGDTIRTPAAGCALRFPARETHARQAPDYAADIVPILQKRCLGCHVEGGTAPFAMNSHMMVQGWSHMMREVLLTRRMPPAQVDPAGKQFSNANYLEPAELQALVHWIDAGAPRGDVAADPLLGLPQYKPRWDLGEPDYVVRVPPIRVPATGVLDYENVTINLPFTEDVWVKSVQHVPGDRRVLHHLLSFIVPADYDARIVEGENDRYREFLEGYAPGKEAASTYPEGTGVFVPAGSAVQMSLHYTTFGREVVDETLLGLYFADTEPAHRYSTFALSHGGTSLAIPPGVSEHRMSATHVFDETIMLHGLRPHMHYRGKYMRFSVVYPDGSGEEILNVPAYSFAWQPTYRLSEPMQLPAGSRVIIEGAFDNSRFNPGNPDPGALVRGGSQSWDEMFIGYFSYHKPR